jgi:hypothetical protein
VALISQTPGLSKEKYRWPLDINNGYSSAFQEFRNNHFHAGLDLRTFQKTGYPVYAIDSGYIFKIRMVKRGSGRGLYLKHQDGNISIYFHLDRFEKGLETLLREVQKIKGKKYFGNFFPQKPLHFKKGQLIGYSGETGSGFPHLHLEIRDSKNVALNPFKLLNLPARDQNFPVLKSILIRNRGESLVNGQIGELFIHLKKLRNGYFISKKPIIFTGNFDLVLNTIDISDTWKMVAPYEITVILDEEAYYSLSFDKFQWEDNNQLGFVYDMYYSSTSSFFYNLFSQKGYSLEKKQMSLVDLIDKLTYGNHQLKIRVKDNYNNMSKAEIEIYKIKKPIISLGESEVTDNQITLKIAQLDAVQADEVKLILKDRESKILYSGNLKHRKLTEDKEFLLNGYFKKVNSIDFNFIKKGIIYYKKQFLLKNQWLSEITDIDYELFINRDEVFVKILDQGFSVDSLQLKVIQGNDNQVINTESDGKGNTYFCFKPINFENKVLLNFSIWRNGRKVVEIQKQLQLIHLREGLKQTFRYFEFGAEYGPKSVYEPKVLLSKEVYHISEYPLLSRQINLSPYHFPFLDTVYYTFKKSLENPRQVGIFKYSLKSKKWYYCYTSYNQVNKVYKTRVLSSGIYALMRDVYKPKIIFKKPKTIHKSKLRRLGVIITDKGKGVNDETLRVLLNGKRVDCEYDYDWKHVVIENLNSITAGKNTLQVAVSDYAGNRSQKSYVFYLRQ